MMQHCCVVLEPVICEDLNLHVAIFFIFFLKYGSWSYDGFKLDVNFYDGLEEVDVADYREGNEWYLLEFPAVKNVK